MKILVRPVIAMFFCTLIMSSIQNTIAIPDMSPQDLYKQSDMVFYGQVISKQEGPGPDYDYYQVKVETYFKNPQTSDSITVAGHKPSENHMTYPQFEVGDKVVFYIVKQDGVLVVSPWSTKAGEGCDIHAFLGPAPIPGEPIMRGALNPLEQVTDVNMTTRGPFKINQVLLIAYHVWNNFPQSRNVTVELSAINQNDTASSFYKNQIVQVGACDANTVNWIFAPTKAGYYIVNATEIGKFRAGADFWVVDSTSSAINSKLVGSPLMQIKSGIAAKDVRCENNLQLIIKAEDGSPACVKPNTANILVERGWAKEVVANNSEITHMDLKAYGSVCCGLDGDLLKGNLSSSTGLISDANVLVSINGIVMGNAKTYPDGCFQFNQWNDSKLSEQTSAFLANEKNSGSFGPFNLTFSAHFAGDSNHDPTTAQATSSMYLIAIPFPPPMIETTVTPSQVNITQGSSANIQISARPMIEQWDVSHMNLSLQGLPCGASYHVSQVSDNDTSSTTHPAVFNVNLDTATYSPEGTYFVGMVQNGTNPLITKDIGTFTLNVLKMR